MQTSGQVILVSGGSRGLGLHLVRRLLAGGNRVASFARHASPEIEALCMAHPEDLLFATCEATDAPAVAALVETVLRRFGRIDGLVNNAAIGQDQLFVHLPPDEIRRLVEVNILAPMLLTRAVLRPMLLAGRGHICSISSITAQRGQAGLAVYAAAKASLEAMTRALAREVGPAGVRVNAVAPGFFASDMSAALDDAALARLRARTPSGRLSEAEDVLAVLDFLLSGQGNLQGQVLVVDGGFSV